MSEKKVTILLCDMPHRREVRATDTLTVQSTLARREVTVDVCSTHADMVLGNGKRPKARRSSPGLAKGEPEVVDRVPAGWIDSEKAAEILDMTRSGVRYLQRTGALDAKAVSVPGHGAPFYIFERSAVRARARERG